MSPAAAVVQPTNGTGANPRVTRIAPARARSGLSLVGDAQLSIFSAQGSVRAEWGIKRYRDAVWAYAAISQVATDISGLPFLIRRGPLPDDPEIEGGGPLGLLLEEPNDLMGWPELCEAVVTYLEAAGRSYLWLNSGTGVGGAVRELWPLRPDRVRPVLADPVGIAGYVWRSLGGAGDQPLPREAVAAFTYFDPIDPIGGGLSPLVPAQVSIDQGIAAARWNASYFAKGARPGIIITTPTKLDEAPFERMKGEIKTTWVGAENAHTPLLLDGFDGKVEDFQPTHKDMSFVELIANVKREQLAAIGVPNTMAGDSDEAHLARAEVEERIYWTKKLVPLCRRIEGVINRTIAKRVQPGAFFRFDLSGVKVLQEDLTAALERDVKAIGAGLATPNEIRERDGKPTYEGGERFYISSTLVPVDSLGDRGGGAPAVTAGDAGAPIGTAAGATQEVKTAPTAAVRLARGAGSGHDLLPADEREIKRTSAWRGFNTRLVAAEKKLEGVWEPELAAIGKHVVARVRTRPPTFADRAARMAPLPDDPSYYLPDAGDLVRELTEKHGRIYKALVQNFGEGAVAAVSSGLAFDEGAPRMLTLLERDRTRIGEAVAGLLDELRDTLEGGLNDGETVADLVERIRGKVGRTRAERIARTEALAAASSGTVEGYHQAGVEQHEWLSSRDQFVRDAHREVDGQVVRVGDAFDVGGEGLMFPGDPQGSAGNVVNCRCTTVPVVGDSL